jgi:hypothetical protein
MKRYCLVKDGAIERFDILPNSYLNISNFNILPDNELVKYGWFPVVTISENKDIVIGTEYIIESDCVKEIIGTRDKSQEEIDLENKNKIDAEWNAIRSKRDILLNQSDFYALSDVWNDLSEQRRIDIANYRKALRDIPQAFNNPQNVIFPEMP